MLENKCFTWNSGIFLFKAKAILKEIEKFSPEVFSTCKNAIDKKLLDLDFQRLDINSFKKCPNISIDIAVMEKTNLGFYVRCVTDVSSQNGNHAYREIFRGDTQHTVTEGTNSLNLRLSPLLDDRELTVPRITRINRPFQMAASSSDNITVAVDTVKKEGSSAVDGTLSYRFRSVDNDSMPLDNSSGGSFSPASGDISKKGSKNPD